ncbi:ATP-binding protein [Streptomyces poonensis]|uniref:ATP-binding protein n=1 Tax=Streptomyces poonensis TaxID=68255 RepID=A0A918PFP8_9ACTN|nr:ATP-binding protein [Streptomyces poonensis]GGZ05838.1 ATP-binding protein [Streptomyces poonensis]GLJ92602.1 ATP-binding protein [Streptomyces poonensis]
MNGTVSGSREGNSIWTVPKVGRGVLTLRFDVEAEHLSVIRRILGDVLEWWGIDPDVQERLVTAVNELLSNVLEHTEPDLNGCHIAELRIQLVPGGISAVVGDRDDRVPAPRPVSSLAEAGRGLTLVRALVDEMNVTRRLSGKDIWVFVAA